MPPPSSPTNASSQPNTLCPGYWSITRTFSSNTNCWAKKFVAHYSWCHTTLIQSPHNMVGSISMEFPKCVALSKRILLVVNHPNKTGLCRLRFSLLVGRAKPGLKGKTGPRWVIKHLSPEKPRLVWCFEVRFVLNMRNLIWRLYQVTFHLKQNLVFIFRISVAYVIGEIRLGQHQIIGKLGGPILLLRLTCNYH